MLDAPEKGVFDQQMGHRNGYLLCFDSSTSTEILGLFTGAVLESVGTFDPTRAIFRRKVKGKDSYEN